MTSKASDLHGIEVRPRSCLRIGEWLVDPDTNELRRDNSVVRIEPKAMDVLVLLAARRGAVVSRDELFAAVWPGVIVGDEALTQSVIKLRRSLGDDPRNPAYIETISKRGYRLIAEVGEVGVSPSSRRPVSWKPWLGAALVAAAVAIAGVWFFAPQPGTPAPDADARQPWVTVAVLPFEALGTDREQGYLAQGVRDNLLTDLSRLSGLRLIRAAAGSPSTAQYQISGTVQRDADVLRINIALVDNRTKEQLWAGRFDRPAGALFAVQDEINAKVVELLPAKVSDVERARLAKRYTRSLDAYDEFLRGQALFLVRREAENDEARIHFRKALERDPKFARAYAGLALTYAMDYRLRAPASASATLDRAFELAQTAQLIDPEIPEVHWAIGFVHAQSRRHEQAMDALQRSIDLDPSFADGYAMLSGVYTYVGRPAESIPLMRTAMRLNPEGGYLYFLVLGRAYLFTGDVEQALIHLRAALMRNPVDIETRVMLAASLSAAGDRAAAAWEADEIRSLAPGFAAKAWLDTYPMTDARQRERLAMLLADVRL